MTLATFGLGSVPTKANTLSPTSGLYGLLSGVAAMFDFFSSSSLSSLVHW